jgi:DNA gyrase subunit A
MLSMSVIRAEQVAAEEAAEAEGGSVEESEVKEQYVFTITDGGYAKRTRISDYRSQGRGGLGIKAMRLADQRGSLIGAIVVTDGDEVMAIRASGQVTRSAVTDVPAKGRDTMGVKFVNVGEGDSVVAIARNAEPQGDDDPASPDDGDAEPTSGGPAAVEPGTDSRETGTEHGRQDAGPPAADTSMQVDEEQPE